MLTESRKNGQVVTKRPGHSGFFVGRPTGGVLYSSCTGVTKKWPEPRRRHGRTRWIESSRLYLDESGSPTRHAQSAAREAGGSGLLPGRVQFGVREGAVHVPRFDDPAQSDERTGVWHQRGHLLRAEGVPGSAAPDVSTVERFQQAGDPRLRRVQ